MKDLETKLQPSEQELCEFWGWCGFRHQCEDWYEEPNGEISQLPPIDLNNLFKYAVPKLHDCIVSFDTTDEYNCNLYTVHKGYTDNQRVRNIDPAVALFWAIWEIIKNE
jgi:hypothetical protein